MCGSTVDIQPATAEIRRGKRKEEGRTNYRAKNIMSASAAQGGHNKVKVFTAQRHASAVYAVVMRLSVRLSVFC